MFINIDSPLQHLPHSLLQQLWVKRDDVIDPYISGNKWRKLKYLLEDAKLKNKKHLITFGGPYSNHLVATAAAAARANLKATAFVRGEPVENEMLLLCRLYGMELLFTDREKYKNKYGLFQQYFSEDNDTYFIDEGGAGSAAVKGCTEMVFELPDDVEHIFCAAGTGTTAAGILMGIKQRNLKTILHVIPVLKGGVFINEEIKKYTDLSPQLVLHCEYHFGGYAKVTDELLLYMKNFTRNTGMLIDPVYTAKMFYAIDDLSKKGSLDPQAKIIAIHTGGLLGIFGMKDKLNRIL